jgi:hypothetical protein
LRAKIRSDEAESAGCGGNHRQGRQRSMAGFWPQPEGKGRIFPIASSLVAKIRPVFVAPHFSHSKKFASFAAALIVLAGPYLPGVGMGQEKALNRVFRSRVILRAFRASFPRKDQQFRRTPPPAWMQTRAYQFSATCHKNSGRRSEEPEQGPGSRRR